MSKKLPFEDAFKKKMNDLPTGNEDAAWQKMKELLERKDRRKPFAWLNIYTICSCIIIIAGLCIWMILFSSHQNNISKTENILVNKKNTSDSKKLNESFALKSDKTNLSTQKNNTDTISKQTTIVELNLKNNKHISVNENNELKNFYKPSSAQTNLKDYRATSTQNLVNKNDNAISTNDIDSLQNLNNNNQNINNNNLVKEKIEPSSSSIEKNDSVKNETIANNLKQPSSFDTAAIKKQIPISFKRKQFFLEAGIQLKQQIPLTGQKLTAYNYSGDKGLFKDYIPSVFIKFEKDRQWFLQGEFGYATPNLVKQFSYSKQSKADYSLSTVTVTTTSLQKTYYDEVPLSFNYYVQPHWSIGTGFIYGWFHGAVAEQEITTNDIKAGSLITTKIIMPFKNFTDSFLYKNQASLLLQTGYSLKRWSFILRYEKGIQPYIKYTLPNGIIESRRNSSIELNIGYRFIKKPL